LATQNLLATRLSARNLKSQKRSPNASDTSTAPLPSAKPSVAESGRATASTAVTSHTVMSSRSGPDYGNGTSCGNGDGAGVGGSSASDATGKAWNIRASDRSLRTINPIRQLVQGITGEPNPAKILIDLSVGDPTRYGNLRVGHDIVEKYCEVVRSGQNNGYTQSMGGLAAREAVARRYTLPKTAPLTAADIVLTSGVSGALELALGALANEGDNVLLPRPGFPLFKTMLDGFGVEARYYSVLPHQSWEVDVADLARIADSRTVAIVINNPSNPCGSVYSAEHIREIVDAASAMRLPIVADEVYADMVFSGHSFVPVASMSIDVPVLSVGGVSKQFVVPGWRAGWLMIHDRNNVLKAGGVRQGINQLSTRMLMTNAPVQAMLPHMLESGSASVTFKALMAELEVNAARTMEGLRDCVGVRCVAPQGSMYLMAEIDVKLLGFSDDLEFTKTLRSEESVFVLPGQCFLAPNYVRIVFCAPSDVLADATDRIKKFCARHAAATSAAVAIAALVADNS
jgi:tyrosine aminotransferase